MSAVFKILDYVICVLLNTLYVTEGQDNVLKCAGCSTEGVPNFRMSYDSF